MDKETLLAALGNPEAAPIIFSTLEEKGYKVFDDGKLKDFETQERNRLEGGVRSEVYTSIDKDVMSTSGLKKNADEKTYDFVKRAVSTFKTEKEQLEAKTRELEQKIKDGGADNLLKSQYEALQAQTLQYKEELSAKDKLLFEKDVNIDLKEGLRELTFSPTYPEPVRKTYVNTILKELTNQARVDDKGKIVYIGDDGKVILNKDLQPADASFILKDRLKDVLEVGRTQTGAGSKPPGDADNSVISIPSSIKSRVELSEYLHKKGIYQDSKEYSEIWKQHASKLPAY